MKKILIIEDDISIAELERDYLEIEGYLVDIEADGTTGFTRALKGKYSLIILDIMLPGSNGFEICKKLREKLSIPILLVTARKEDIDKIRGLGLGADDYITKPFSPGEMMARVKAHLERYERLTGGQREEGIQINNLRLDESTRRVYVDKKEISLTMREFDILCLLMKNPDRVFSKEQIFDIVWGTDTFGDLSTVTVHVRKIREKIERNPNNPEFVQTVWGVGYRLSP